MSDIDPTFDPYYDYGGGIRDEPDCFACSDTGTVTRFVRGKWKHRRCRCNPHVNNVRWAWWRLTERSRRWWLERRQRRAGRRLDDAAPPY